MAHIRVDCDELYPYFIYRTEDDDDGFPLRPNAEVDDATIARWDRIAAEFKEMQKELEALDDAAREEA